MTLGKKPEAKKPTISMNIGGPKKIGVTPIKMALPTQVYNYICTLQFL